MASNSGTVYINSPSKDKAKSEGQPQPRESNNKLEELVHRSGYVIFETSTRPSLFNVFSDKIIITPSRLTITKQGLFNKDEYPMAIENITNARMFSHFSRASITIETFGIPKPEPITNLRIEDARKLRRYILALVECKKAGIDLSNMNLEELRDKLLEIGTVRHSSEEDHSF